jgi:hypothetical protein
LKLVERVKERRKKEMEIERRNRGQRERERESKERERVLRFKEGKIREKYLTSVCHSLSQTRREIAEGRCWI